MELSAGDLLMEIGGHIRFVPLVLGGLLKLTREDNDGDELLLYHVGPGETCAISLTCCMTDARSTVRVVAEEDTRILAIPVRFMDEWTDKFRSWKTFVLLTYQRRFEELLRTVDGLAFQKLDGRILDLLRQQARDQRTSTLSVTHQQIAAALHSSREVVSRLLKRMEKEGIVRLGRQRIELLLVQ